MDVNGFRREIEHDRLLISLVKELNGLGKLDLLGKYFHLSPTGDLVHAGRRQYCDVELSFEKLSVVVETKVDSDENHRWDSADPHRWQTYEIESNANQDRGLKPEKQFRFVTFGTSEYYTKEGCLPGAANPKFRHIYLRDMHTLLEACLTLPLTKLEDFKGWYRALSVEKAKRDNVIEILSYYSHFRDRYLSCADEIDLPTNRLAFNAPELAFPLFSKLSEAWNDRGHNKRFGKLALYPVPRSSPKIHDSILNFWELWSQGDSFSCQGLLPKMDWCPLYLEINEDYNLNLKLGGEKDLADQVAAFLDKKQLREIHIPTTGTTVKGRPRFYHQTVYVLYEWDFGLLSNVNNLERAADDLFFTTEYLSKELQ